MQGNTLQQMIQSFGILFSNKSVNYRVMLLSNINEFFVSQEERLQNIEKKIQSLEKKKDEKETDTHRCICRGQNISSQ
jgi:hypothetical protein